MPQTNAMRIKYVPLTALLFGLWLLPTGAQVIITPGLYQVSGSNTTVNLSTDTESYGTVIDWKHFGNTISLTADDYKSGGTLLPSAISEVVGPANSSYQLLGYGGNPIQFTWTDGTNTANQSSPNGNGVYNNNGQQGYGFTFTTGVLTQGQTYELRLYTGAYIQNTTLVAVGTLSDGATATNSSITNGTNNDTASQIIFTFTPSQTNDSLTVNLTEQSTIPGSNITLNAFSLSTVPEPSYLGLPAGGGPY